MKMNEIEIKFTPQERDLIIDHTFAGPDLIKRLQIAEIKGDCLIVKYSTFDLDELIGFIAAGVGDVHQFISSQGTSNRRMGEQTLIIDFIYISNDGHDWPKNYFQYG
jgi:hypothetical protein